MPEITLDIPKIRAAIVAQGISQSTLVSRSGLSRAQIGRLLSTDRPLVREKTWLSLSRALGVDPASLTVGGGLQKFRECTADDLGSVDFRGIGMPMYQWQSIDAVFIEPDVVPEKSSLGDACGFDEGTPSLDGRRPPVLVTEAIRGQDRIILLGDPGSGKTTVLKWLAYTHARSGAGGRDLPIYVRLPEFSRAQEIDPRIDLFKFVLAKAMEKGCGDIESPLKKELSNCDRRQCLVLFDGLDEVGDEEHRDRLVNSVSAFIEEFPANRFVITSRLVGFDALPWTNLSFAGLRILDYTPRHQHEFAEKWSKILAMIHHRPEAEVLARLKSAIFSSSAVRALAANPLILTTLVLLNESRGGALPRRRVDLYAKIVEVFLDTWEASKRSSDTFDETFSIDLDSREFRWLLSDLSLAMQKTDRTLAPRWWLADRMRDYLQEKMGFGPEEARDASERIIRYLVGRTGLIQECGLDVFGFSHRTLQEYFASLGAIYEADASCSRSLMENLREYFFNPRWCEVLRLVAAQQTPPVAESLLTCILDDADPVGRFLRRGVFLALRCLSDGTTVPNRSLVASIFSSLTDLGGSKWLGITLEAFDVLDSFDGTRMHDLAKSTIASILETAEEQLAPEEFDCLNERAHFSSIFEQAEAQLDPNFESEAAREVAVPIDRRICRVVYINTMLRTRDPAAWYRSALSLLGNKELDDGFKVTLIREVGQQIVTDPRSRRSLRKLLESSASAILRAACAHVLGSKSKKRDDAKILVRVLEQDPEIKVRVACAGALKDIASRDLTVRNRLMQILESDAPTELRSGAARGLSKAASRDVPITDALLRIAQMHTAPDELRVACVSALENQLGRKQNISEAFKLWIDSHESPKVQRIAAEAIAEAIGEDKMPWEHSVVDQVEQCLMGLDKPCSHALAGLEALAATQEARRGLRLENVLRDALKSMGGRIEMAFVFGSTARNRQTQDSDIDLMIIGDVTLKDLATPLRSAEKSLGRRISPVIYTRKSFQHKYHKGDPFLIDVRRREKISLLGRGGTFSQKELDDELRAMVAERLASA